MPSWSGIGIFLYNAAEHLVLPVALVIATLATRASIKGSVQLKSGLDAQKEHSWLVDKLAQLAKHIR